MQVDHRIDRDVAVFGLHGDVKGGEEFAAFRRVLSDALSNGYRKIVVNFAGVKWIDANGLAALVLAYSDAAKRQVELCVAEVPKSLWGIMEIGPTFPIQVFANEAEAVTALHQERTSGETNG